MPRDPFDAFRALDDMDAQLAVFDDPNLRAPEGQTTYRSVNKQTGTEVYGYGPPDSAHASRLRDYCLEIQGQRLPAQAGDVTDRNPKPLLTNGKAEGTVDANNRERDAVARHASSDMARRGPEVQNGGRTWSKREGSGVVEHHYSSPTYEAWGSAPKYSRDARVNDAYARHSQRHTKD